MLYVLEFFDGTILTSVETKWRNIPNENIRKFGIYDTENKFHQLEGYDIWFFSDIGIFMGGKQKWEGRMIGGFKKDGKGKVIQVFVEGGCKELDANLKIYREKFSPLSFKENI